MQSTTIEQYLDNRKKSSDKLIKEVEDNYLTKDELKLKFLDKSEEIEVDREKFKNVLTNIELLFDKVPDKEYDVLFINYYDELSKLDGDVFNSWLNHIEFNARIEDDLKISYVCSLYDFEFTQWFSIALKDCAPNPKQEILIYLLNYQNLVEGFYSKSLNILIYAMIKTSICGNLVVKYPSGGIKYLEKYKNVSKLDLSGKLLALQSDSTYEELSAIAKVCKRDLRNAVAHHSFILNETEKKIEFKGDQLSFNDFIETALELVEYRTILVECFHYYSMKSHFESKGLLKK